jgi:hypothetical protein
MISPLKLFGWLFTLSIFIASFGLRIAPLPILFMVVPTFALFQLIWASNILNPLPTSHWAFRIPGLLWLRSSLQYALNLPTWVRILILCVCIFGGLGLAKLAA